ncbi:MAG: hypothetical protein LBM65_04665 [Oscillospiraceae bacterium]|nr:hypothetical protein [Oscillospiraceae bacterium]
MEQKKNYFVWADEYLNEAEVVKRRINVETTKLKATHLDERLEIKRNIMILRSILYELKSTARHLQNRGEGKG